MILNDLNQDFYRKIEGQHVLLLVHNDVDALCACRILVSLFTCSHISYTLMPVHTVHDMESALLNHCFVNKTNYVVTLNCGANLNIIGDFETEIPALKDTIFFVFDSHRPFNLDNIYDNAQVFVFTSNKETTMYPPKEDIYRDSSDSDDSENDDINKRRRLDEAVVEKAVKRKNKQTWIAKRSELIFDYYQFSYSERAISVLFLELCNSQSKATAETCWWALVGITSQLLDSKMGVQEYTGQMTEPWMHAVIKKLSSNQLKGGSRYMKHVQITFHPKYLNLNLLGEWSLLSSLQHTQSTVCTFSLWSQKGNTKFLRYLADLGLPRNECNQRFDCIKSELGKEIIPAIEKNIEKYNLKDILVPSFQARFNYAFSLCTKDAAMALASLLEFHSLGSTFSENFSTAFEMMTNAECYDGALHKYSSFLQYARRVVDSVINERSIEPRGPFLLLNLEPSGQEVVYLKSTHGVTVIGTFLLNAFLTQTHNKRHSGKPLMMVVPSEDGIVHVTGIPPAIVLLEEDRPKSFLGRAFERAANQSKIKFDVLYCDDNVVRIQERDKLRFFDSLLAILEV